MSNFTTHLLAGIGATTALTLVLISNNILLPEITQQLIILFTIGVVASLLPDIDSQHSKPRKVFQSLVIASAIIALICFMQSRDDDLIVLSIVLLMVVLLVWNLTHGGFMHRITTPMVFSAALWYFFGVLVAGYFIVGYGAHLVVDGLSKKRK